MLCHGRRVWMREPQGVDAAAADPKTDATERVPPNLGAQTSILGLTARATRW
jgi:hypothetical protein